MPSGKDTLDLLNREVGRRFPVRQVMVYSEGVVFLVDHSMGGMDEDFEALRMNLREMGFIATLRESGGQYSIGVMKMPPVNTRSVRVNQIMLILTMATTVISGSFLWGSYSGDLDLLAPSNLLWGAVYFALPLLLILGTHELSHFFMARRHGLNASLPFFIPSIPPIGTFGAFISIREPLPNRKALLDVGISGPIGGFIVTLPVLFLGYHLTAVGGQLAQGEAGVMALLGVPLGMQLVSLLYPAAEGMFMHPTLFAAWLGLFVTGINLLPAGQLDGGHIARSVLGERTKWMGIATVAALLVLSFFYTGWLIFAALIYFLGVIHPPPLNDITPLDRKRRVLAGAALLLLLFCFTPLPIQAA